MRPAGYDSFMGVHKRWKGGRSDSIVGANGQTGKEESVGVLILGTSLTGTCRIFLVKKKQKKPYFPTTKNFHRTRFLTFAASDAEKLASAR